MDTPRTNIMEFPAGDASHAGRAPIASAALSLFAAAVVIAGLWGAILSFGDGPAPAAIGEDIEVPGGSFRVDAAIPEHMAPMQAGKFAASGMSMSAMGMDMAPKGSERFTVEVTMTGGEGLSYSPEDFRVSGDGMSKVAPIRHQLEEGAVSGGSSVSGSMVFEAPEDAENLILAFDGGRTVSLSSPTGRKPGDSHDH